MEKIHLTCLNGTGSTFKINDYKKIREDFRILGSPVGVCRTQGWNSRANGFPIVFTKHETQLLIDKGFAILLQKDSLLEESAPELVKDYQNLIRERDKEQGTYAKGLKIEALKHMMPRIIAGKRKKLLESGIPAKDIKINGENTLKKMTDNFVFNSKNSLVELPYAHPIPHAATIVDLTEDNSLEYRVFKDLWEKGKYVTSGETFGGDFLAYPGDPLLYHASHIVVVNDSPKIESIVFVTKARLAINVKKNLVFAYLNEKNEICYQTVEWQSQKNRRLSEDTDVVGKLEKADDYEKKKKEGNDDEFSNVAGPSTQNFV